MKKINVFMSMVFSLALVIMMNSTVLAQDLTSSINEDNKHIEENASLNDVASLCVMCVNCETQTIEVCRKEQESYDYGYHKNLLGQETDCYAVYYRSSGALRCPACGTYSKYYGFHDCFERHSKCSYGDYDTCPFDYIDWE